VQRIGSLGLPDIKFTGLTGLLKPGAFDAIVVDRSVVAGIGHFDFQLVFLHRPGPGVGFVSVGYQYLPTGPEQES